MSPRLAVLLLVVCFVLLFLPCTLIVVPCLGLLLGLGAYGYTSVLSTSTLETDLASLRAAFGDDYGQHIKQLGPKHVVEYYTQTTDRDYQWLAAFVGPGMQTQLQAPYPIEQQGGNTRQPALILAELRAVGAASRVLEVGCGRGHCSLFLAAAAPEVHFIGIDVVSRHVAAARKACCRGDYRNVQFYLMDATLLSSRLGTFDLIFGCEALCHMDTRERAADFIRSASALLRPGGRLVIIDGFRSDAFSMFSAEEQTAMRLAEAGFRIRAMPSSGLWRKLAINSGFLPVRTIDLTNEALPFWARGWRVGRVLLLFPHLVRAYAVSAPRRRESAASLISIRSSL